jgi:hypothetical protein
MIKVSESWETSSKAIMKFSLQKSNAPSKYAKLLDCIMLI